MGTRENKVETYLKSEVKYRGGLSRKWVSPGQDGVPDQLVFLKGIWLVEVKTDDGHYEKSQVREQFRLRKQGLPVRTVFGEKGVGEFFKELEFGFYIETPRLYEVTKCWGKKWEKFQC